jgi:hypothetical protein
MVNKGSSIPKSSYGKAHAVPTLGVQKIPRKILKKTWKKFGRAPQIKIRTEIQ